MLIFCGLVDIKNKSNFISLCQAWWFMPLITALWRLREEDREFEASLRYIVRSGLQETKQKMDLFMGPIVKHDLLK
jgi:hypothetical protein